MNRITGTGAPLSIVAALMLLAGCDGSATPPTVPTTGASIAGRITMLERRGERVGTVRVEADPSKPSGSDKAVVRITHATRVIGRDGNPSDHDALAEGQWVRVWFTGPVAESYPVQAAAGTVTIDSLPR